MRWLARLFLASIFVHAGVSKLTSWTDVVAWAHNALESNGLSLDKLLGVDDVGVVPMLVGIALFLELFGTLVCTIPAYIACLITFCAGGLLLALGFEQEGSKLLIAFLILVCRHALLGRPFNY